MTLLKVKANGGMLIHLLPYPVTTMRALCGHEPKDTARMMRSRGRWSQLKDQTRPATCKLCLHKATAE